MIGKMVTVQEILASGKNCYSTIILASGKMVTITRDIGTVVILNG